MASPLNNLNSDFYATVVNVDGRQRQVIYSTRADLKLAPAGSPATKSGDVVAVAASKDLWVYADTVTLLDNIEIPGGDIKIVARRLRVPEDQSATLRNTPGPVSFKPADLAAVPTPSTPGASGKAGNNGQDGADNVRSIVVVAEDLQCDPIGPGFKRIANGTFIKEVKFHAWPARESGAEENMTLDGARARAEQYGGQLATLEEVRLAWEDGLHVFAYGMLNDGSFCVPIQRAFEAPANSRRISFKPKFAGFERGVNPAKGGNDGFFYVTKNELESSFWVETCGGNGAPGQDGQNGQAGAAGADSVLWKILTKQGVLTTIRGRALESGWKGPAPANYEPVQGRDDLFTVGGDGGYGGDGGPGGTGGNGGNIELVLPPKAAANVVCRIDGGTHGADGKGGDKGLAGRGGIETTIVLGLKPNPGIFAGNFLYRPGNDPISVREKPRGKDGNDGNPRARQPKPGTGEAGSWSIKAVDPGLLAEYFDSAYFLKLLMRAKNLYLMCPPDQLKRQTEEPDFSEHPGAILAWLVKTLKKLKEDKETLDPEVKLEFKRKREVLRQASALRRSFRLGLTLFGRVPNWVPRRSLASYLADMKRLEGPLTQIEGKFQLLQEKSDDEENNRGLLQTAFQQVANSQSAYTERRDALCEEANEVLAQIDEGTAALNRIRQRVQAVVDEYKLDLSNYHSCKFDLQSIFRALESMFFMGELSPKHPQEGDETGGFKGPGPMALLQGVELVTGLVQANLREDGIKKYLSQELVIISKENHLQSLQGEIVKRAESDPDSGATSGQLVLREGQLPWLIADLEQFEKDISEEEFKAAFPDGGSELSAATYDLKETMRLRSEAITAYNGLVARAMQVQAQLEQLDERKNELDTKSFRMADPGRPGKLSYVAALYQDLRDQAIELIYLAERALAFWAVDSKPALANYQKSLKLWQDGELPSDFNATKLVDALTNIRNRIIKHEEDLGRSAIASPKGGAKAEVKSWHTMSITGRSQLAAFRKSYSLTFKTKPSTVSKTDSMREVRVTHIRPRLVFAGSCPLHEAITFHAKHLGDERLTSRTGATVSFAHAPVAADFTYEPRKPAGQDWARGQDGSFTASHETNDPFALPGLFASWQLSLDSDDADKLELWDLSAIEVEFGVRYYQKV